MADLPGALPRGQSSLGGEPLAVPSYSRSSLLILTYLMFMVFAMSTDSVGPIIARLLKEYTLTQTQAGAFHYAPMLSIALAGFLLGSATDRLGPKRAVLLGLGLYSLSSCLMAVGNSLALFLSMLAVAGVGICLFRTGAVALVGQLASSPVEHSSLMNRVEGFFALGSLAGPLLVAALLQEGYSWKGLYLAVGLLAVGLLLAAAVVRFPEPPKLAEGAEEQGGVVSLLGDPVAMGFASLAFLYVAVECAVYVWMPTWSESYSGPYSWLARNGVAVFFGLRALGRFLGSWFLQRFEWTLALLLCSLAVFLLFSASMLGGLQWAIWTLPATGLFLSILFPTISSKGLSCFPSQRHGAVGGLFLGFAAGAAALGPLAMGLVSDAFRSPEAGFYLATGLAGLLTAGLGYNWWRSRTHGL